MSVKTHVGESRRYLEVDLGSRSFSVYQAPEELLRDYIGGAGLGLRLFEDRLGSRLSSVEPLGPDNLLLFMAGTFIGTGAPCSARFAGVTRSPLTGLMLSSSCGGPFGMALKTSGWDGLLVSGRADSPTLLVIDEAGASFEDGASLWGLETGEAQARILSGPKDGALVVGPAAENGVLYANIRSGERYLGRGGMGAVMGAKLLKAIVARGGAFKIEPADRPGFDKARARAMKYMKRNAFIASYRDYGTNYGVNPGVEAGYAPVRNFRDRTDERCRALSGQAMAARYSTSHAVCQPCAVLCGHKGSYPDGKVRHIPEYETVGVWGGNILNFDPDLLAVWNERMNELGLDTISAGVTVAWAMEAAEKGLRPSELAFGKTDNILGLLEDIAYRRGEGEELSLGTRRLASRYGGLEFAAQVKGLELAAYDPRAAWGQALNYAVANRGGCHLNAYPIALEVLFGYLPPYSRLAKAGWVAFLEDLYSAVNSTHTCLFTIYGYLLEPPVARLTPKPLLRLAMTFLPGLARRLLDWSALSDQVAAITGRRLTQRGFLLAGRRAHVLERSMNLRLGGRAADDTLPARFTTEAATKHPVEKAVPIASLVRAYYRAKGYDREGRPRPALLASLGLGKLAAGYLPPPPRRPLARLYARLALAIVGRAFPLVQALDAEARRELAALPAGFSFALAVHPRGPEARLRLGSDGRLRYLAPVKTGEAGGPPPDLLMSFRTLTAALQVLTFSRSSFEVYAKGGFALRGDLGAAMVVMRAFGIVQTVLLPGFIARRVLKRLPAIPLGRLLRERLGTYLALPFAGPVKERP